MHIICCTLHPHFLSQSTCTDPYRSSLKAPSLPQATPFPLPHRKLISKHYSRAHRHVWLYQEVWRRVNGAWCKRGDTAVCSCFTAKLPIQQLSKALKHVLQAHLKHTFCPLPPNHQMQTCIQKRKRGKDHPSNHSLNLMVDKGIWLARLDCAVVHHQTGWWRQ